VGGGAITKGNEKRVGGDGCIHYFHCGNGFMDTCVKNCQIIHFKYVQFIIHQLNFNKT
jgi:hypothetical protein